MKAIIGCLLAALTLFAGPARAQDYPTRPIKVLIAFPVGGLLDTVTRVVAEKMSGLLGQQMVVEARPGAGGTIATAAVAKAEPDGYTLMMINDNHSLNPSVFKNMAYDSIKDFAPIGFVGSAPLVFVVNASLPIKSVKDLVAYSKANEKPLNYASVGIGSASHLAGEMFNAKAGVKMLHVPYRGGAPALNDLIAGHVNSMQLSAVIGLPHIKAGRLSPIGVAAPNRLEVLPDVPTLAQAGAAVDAGYWFGLVAPAGTPPAILAKLEKALAETLAMPDVKKRLSDMGAIVTPLGQKAFGDFIKAEMDKWADVIKTNNITFN
jgi:tripartite-type tricarboxylate transporter receptor subunit TctC